MRTTPLPTPAGWHPAPAEAAAIRPHSTANPASPALSEDPISPGQYAPPSHVELVDSWNEIASLLGESPIPAQLAGAQQRALSEAAESAPSHSATARLGKRARPSDQPAAPGAPAAQNNPAGPVPGGENRAATAGTARLRQQGFSDDQIKRITKFRGGDLTLQAVGQNLGKLTALGFNPQQITKIASHDNGSASIHGVIGHFNILSKMGLSNEQITRIAGNSSGARSILAIIGHFDTLRKMGFTLEQIARIASNNSGALATEATLRHFRELSRLGFSPEQISRIAGNNSGAQAIYAVIDHAKILSERGFSPEHITRIAGREGGAQGIRAVIAHFEALQTRNLTVDQITKVAGVRGSKNPLEVLAVQPWVGRIPLQRALDLASNSRDRRALSNALAQLPEGSSKN